jgi:hypothetical protein
MPPRFRPQNRRIPDARIALSAHGGTGQVFGRLAGIAIGVHVAAVGCTAPFLEEAPRAAGGSPGTGGEIPAAFYEQALPCHGHYYCVPRSARDQDFCSVNDRDHVPVECPAGCAQDNGDDPDALCIGGLGGAGGLGDGLGGAGGLGGAAGAPRW